MVHGEKGYQQKERKMKLEKAQEIRCGRCKYNRGENAKRKEKDDRYKDIDRETIRRDI